MTPTEIDLLLVEVNRLRVENEDLKGRLGCAKMTLKAALREVSELRGETPQTALEKENTALYAANADLRQVNGALLDELAEARVRIESLTTTLYPTSTP